MKWGIGIDAENQYISVEAERSNSLIATPEGHPIVSDSREFINFISGSMEYFGDSVCSGMSPYGIESSFIDYQISNKNTEHFDALLSAYDECKRNKSISRDEWINTIQNSSPRNVAVLMCICGNIGSPQVAYNIVNDGLGPPICWLQGICGIRGYVGTDTDLIFEAASNNEGFGDVINNLPDFEWNCRECVSDTDDFDKERCAIGLQFSMIVEYARLAKESGI